jgi:hypothetical protein
MNNFAFNPGADIDLDICETCPEKSLLIWRIKYVTEPNPNPVNNRELCFSDSFSA